MKKISSIVFVVLLTMFYAGCSKEKFTGSHAGEVHDGEQGHNEEGNNGHAHTEGESKNVSVSEESMKTMGLKLMPVAYRGMEDTLSVTGEAAKDTDKTYHVLAGSEGTISDIKAQYGDAVHKGSILATIKNVQTATEKEIRSEYNGIVTGVNSAVGQQVDAITSLFTISDVSSMYATFDIYEKDAGKVRVGQQINVTSVAYPNTLFRGTIVFISPRIDDTSRTIKVRAEIINRGYLLKHSMFLNGTIVLSRGHYMVVPLKALQQSGDDHIVFVRKGTSEFEPRKIEIGFDDGEYVQVKRGLRRGEKVAVEGSFLLKSELLKSKMGEGCAE